MPNCLPPASAPKVEHRPLPTAVRVIFILAGAVMMVAGFTGWPIDTIAKQALLVLGGALTIASAIFGVRRSICGFLQGGADLLVFALSGLIR